MNHSTLSAQALAPDTKPHFYILDGFRGVAALIVVWYHIFESFATSPYDQKVNHGYLAVDFFFLLSGFVMAYAYDNRWRTMSITSFIKRRLIRLHPMLIVGALIGGAMYYTQGFADWKVATTSVGAVLLATLLNALLIPSTPTAEIRGIGEMYPLNGPSWSLFFEYIGSLLYATILHRLPTRVLGVLTALFAIGLTTFALTSEFGHIGVGWTMTPENMIGGSLRLLFSFTAGLFLFRVFRPIPVRGAFWLGALVILILTIMPRIGTEVAPWTNGIYDSLCTILIFPALVYVGASTKVSSSKLKGLCDFLGRLSYPLYIIHYPFLYTYYAWVKNNQLSFGDSIWGALSLFFGCILLAYILLRVYDEPLRRYLSKRG